MRGTDDHFSSRDFRKSPVSPPKQSATITRTHSATEVAEPGRLPVRPVMSCTARGLSCPLRFRRGGELLPRHFTLTDRKRTAVYFLRHFPSVRHYTGPPRLSPGALPCGVRTFLYPPKETAIISGPFRCELRRGRSIFNGLCRHPS